MNECMIRVKARMKLLCIIIVKNGCKNIAIELILQTQKINKY